MSILTVLVVIVVAGVGLYCANAYLPMDPKLKKILNVVVVLLVVLWLLSVFGVFDAVSLGTVPRVGQHR